MAKNRVLEKMFGDKKALSKCIREKGDIKKVLNERKIKLSTPVTYSLIDIKDLKIGELVIYKNRFAKIQKIHNKKVTIKLDCGLYINGYRQTIFCVFPKSLKKVW